MNPKFVEIRDRATFIPALAFQIRGKDGYLARRAGFGETGCVYLIKLSTEECQYDPFNWNNRTMQTAHHWLTGNWENVVDGEVVDVEFILGESNVKKVSERYTVGE